jgi:perosamine synthetase
MPVHYCGLPCDMDELLKIGREKNILIVEDASHAFGSSYKGKRIGSFGDITCFSFDPIKNLTCGEGGAVALSNDTIAKIIRTKRILGIDKDAWNRSQNEQSWFYEVTTQGYRYHMSNINASIGIAQLRKFEKFIQKKKDIVKKYNDVFININDLKILSWNLQEMAPFAYIIRVLNGERENLIEFLIKRGVGFSIHYIPNHLQPFFMQYKAKLPVTEQIGKEILTLPLYYDMTDKQITIVIKAVKDYFSQK